MSAAPLVDHVIRAGDGWTHPLHAGQTLRITDLDGNQAVDTLFFDLHRPQWRYDAALTVRRQQALYLTTGSLLMGSDGEALAEITADTCGRHDTLGGACACESNQVRYGLDRLHMHSCRDTFLHQALTEAPRHGCILGKRDLAHNINFFMNVPVTPEGGLTFADGVSGPGRQVSVRARRDLLIVISNCPQLNNPCNGWDPTPVRVEILPP